MSGGTWEAIILSENRGKWVNTIQIDLTGVGYVFLN
jgi:hypothetical protein